MDTADTTVLDSQLPSERIAGSILPKVLNSFDMTAIMVGIVLFIVNAPLMTGAGPAAFVYWILGFLTFLIPGAFVTGQLGLMFPGEGSIYVWTHKAFGSLWGFLAGFCAWFPGVLGLVVTSDGAVSLIQQMNPHLLTQPWQQGLAIIVILALSLLLSLLRFRVTQTIINTVFVLYGGAILLVGLAGVAAIMRGQAAPVDYSAHTWLPTPATFTFYGTVILALLGIEVPLNMGVEITTVRAITRYLLWGSSVIMLAYLLGTFGVMTAVPLKDQSNIASVTLAVTLGFGGPVGQVLGTIVGSIFIGFFIFTTAVFNYSFARLLFVSGLDRRMPAVMSRVNSNRVPWVAVLTQSCIAAVVTCIVFILAPLFFHILAPQDLTTVIYDFLQAVLVVIWGLSMVTLFVDVLIIRRKYSEAFARVQLAPHVLFTISAVLGIAASAIGLIVTFTNPWTPLVSTAQWDTAILGLVVLAAIIALVTFVTGRQRTDLSDEQLVEQVLGATSVPGGGAAASLAGEEHASEEA